MKKVVLILIAAAFAGGAYAQDNRGVSNGTSLGDVTSGAIGGTAEGGRAQGQHASDPAEDGVGRRDDKSEQDDQPRDGLANAIDDHDLSSTIDAIK